MLTVAACNPGIEYPDEVIDPGQIEQPEPVVPDTPEEPPQPVVLEKLPQLEITTVGGAAVDSKEDYVRATIRLSGDNGTLEAEGKVRGRGNATWDYEKKPYKIKLDEKMSLCGFPADRDWVLLAEYCDKSLMRTAWMCALSRLAGMPYTINYQHIDLTLNGEYLGIYLLADQVERASHRVNISSDGYLFENDNYWYNEPLYFSTATHHTYFTFKYPDADDEQITRISDNFYYIRDFMNDMETALYGPDFCDPQMGYRAYLDAESFARWYLVNELLGNYDPNLYYVLDSPGALLQMWPLWDAEWSLGLAARGEHGGWASPPATSPVEFSVWSTEKYFARLMKDPWFVDLIRLQWADLKPLLPEFRRQMHEKAISLQKVQEANFERWPLLDEYVSVGLIALGSWEAEIAYIEDFFEKRVEWFDRFISGFGTEEPNE